MRLKEVAIVLVLVFIFAVLLVKYYDPKVLNPKPSDFSVDMHVDYLKLEEEIVEKQVFFDENRSGGEAKSVPVLVYHGVTPFPESGSVTIDQFKQHMFALKKAGYETVTQKDLYEFLKGTKTLPDKSFVLTFDDGRKSSFYNTDLILKALDYKAAMFIVAKYSVEGNHRYYLNKAEINEMRATGRWEIGAHSYNGHVTIPIDSASNRNSFYGNKLWLNDENRLETDDEFYSRVGTDLIKAKNLVREEFNPELLAFALPFSDFGQYKSNDRNVMPIMSLLLKQNFPIVYYQFKPIANRDFRSNYPDPGQGSDFVIRLTVYSEDSALDVMEQMEASRALDLPYAEDYSSRFRWIDNWGKFSLEKDSISLVPGDDKTTGLVYLDGSYLWTDYEYSFSTQFFSDLSVAQLVRYQNPENYLACLFRGNSVSAVMTYNNSTEVLKQAALPSQIHLTDGSFVVLSTFVGPREISCSINGIRVLTANHLDAVSHGGIGIKMFTTVPNQSIVINQISVK